MRISDWSSDVCSSDLFHHEKEDWQTVGPQTYEGPGWLPIYTLERMLGRDIESGRADTIGGLVMQTLDRVPQTGDMVEIDRLRIEVRSEERRVGKEGVSTCCSRWSPCHKKKKK